VRSVGRLLILVGDPVPSAAGWRGQTLRWPSGAADAPDRARSVLLVASDLGWLRECATGPVAWVSTRRVSITVLNWSPPAAGWIGRLGPVPGLLRHRVRRGRLDRVEVQVALARPQPFYVVLAAALDVLGPRARQPSPVSTDVAAYGDPPRWLPGSANVAGLVGLHPSDEVIRPYDALVAADGDGRFPGVAAVRPDQVLVDAAVANPRGYAPPAADAADVPLTGDLGRLRSARSVSVDSSADPVLVAKVAMTGVVLLADAPPSRLDPALRAVLAEPRPTEELDWEIRSVRQRRAAMRGHATGVAMPAAIGVVPPTLRRPSVSALVLADDRLPSVLAALQAQTYPDVEIVVGVSSRSAEVDRAIAECSRPVRVAFGGLDALTARAHGALLTVIDSADVYGPEHVWDLVLARHYSGATLVGKAAEFIFLSPLDVTLRRTGVATEAFAPAVSPGAAMISRADLESVGGWTDLCVRVRRAGGLVYRSHSFGYLNVRRGLSAADQLLKQSASQWTGVFAAAAS
jgi:hypothetical protein